jgi:hypothetical protein
MVEALGFDQLNEVGLVGSSSSSSSSPPPFAPLNVIWLYLRSQETILAIMKLYNCL